MNDYEATVYDAARWPDPSGLDPDEIEALFHVRAMWALRGAPAPRVLRVFQPSVFSRREVTHFSSLYATGLRASCPIHAAHHLRTLRRETSP